MSSEWAVTSNEPNVARHRGRFARRLILVICYSLLVTLLAACGGGAKTPAVPKGSVAPFAASPTAAARVAPNVAAVTQTPGAQPAPSAAPNPPQQTNPANPNEPTAGITEVGTADARTLNPILIADPTSLA